MKVPEKRLSRILKLANSNKRITFEEKLIYLNFAISKLKNKLNAEHIAVNFTCRGMDVLVLRHNRKTTYFLPMEQLGEMPAICIFHHVKEQLK